jgi:hypothetical protein
MGRNYLFPFPVIDELIQRSPFLSHAAGIDFVLSAFVVHELIQHL